MELQGPAQHKGGQEEETNSNKPRSGSMDQKYMGQNRINEKMKKKIQAWAIVAVVGALYFAVAVMVAIERNQPKFELCPLCGQEVKP